MQGHGALRILKHICKYIGECLSTEARISSGPTRQAFFDSSTRTVSYVLSDDATKAAAIIDPVLDFDIASGRIQTKSAEQILEYISASELAVEWILETHCRADRISGARYVKERVGGTIAAGENIQEVRSIFRKLYSLEGSTLLDGNQFDHLFEDGESFCIGEIQATAILVPGHTPAGVAFAVDGSLFVGDTLLMPDLGTVRADFPGADAAMLYRSIRRLLDFPPQTQIHVSQDYPSQGRELQWVANVQEHRAKNILVHDGITEEMFVEMRNALDRTLDLPSLVIRSGPLNVRAGKLPPTDDHGVSYLRVPINTMLKAGASSGANKA